MDPLRHNSKYFDTEGYYICTAERGTGFYTRKNFNLKGTYPVPLKYAEDRNVQIKQQFRNVVVNKPIEKMDFNKLHEKDNFVQNLACCIFVLGISYVAFVTNKIAGVLLFIPALILAFVILFRKSKMQEKDEKVYYERYVNKEAYIECRFLTPKPKNQDDYYLINQAEDVASSYGDSIAGKILKQYAKCLQNPDFHRGFNAEENVPDAVISSYADICASFEKIIAETLVYKVDFIGDFIGEIVSNISLSQASMYVGVFDYIQCRYDVPVIDFDKFRIYLYPTFLIKAYDAFAFEVYDYNQAKINIQDIVCPLKNPISELVEFYGQDDVTRVNLYRMALITMEFANQKYQILCSNVREANSLKRHINDLYHGLECDS